MTEQEETKKIELDDVKIKDCVQAAILEVFEVIEKHCEASGIPKKHSATWLFYGRVANNIWANVYKPAIAESLKQCAEDLK